MSQVPQHLPWGELFDYSELTGALLWKARPITHFKSGRDFRAWNTRFAGTAAGALVSDGRLRVSIGRRRVYVAVIVWEMFNGPVPDGMLVDHEDLNPLNDRRENLRLATRSQNNSNVGLRMDNVSGLKGVHYDPRRDKHVAQISIEGKKVWLGGFDTPEDAHAAYCEKSNNVRAQFSRTQ